MPPLATGNRARIAPDDLSSAFVASLRYISLARLSLVDNARRHTPAPIREHSVYWLREVASLSLSLFDSLVGPLAIFIFLSRNHCCVLLSNFRSVL